MDWNKYKKYFKPAEFFSLDIKDEEMQESFMDLLFKARTEAKTSFKITSGYRSLYRNTIVGGSRHSSHMKGCACDIRITSSIQRYKILNALLDVGFNRFGIGENYIHVDNDKEKDKNAMWVY